MLGDDSARIHLSSQYSEAFEEEKTNRGACNIPNPTGIEKQSGSPQQAVESPQTHRSETKSNLDSSLQRLKDNMDQVSVNIPEP